MAAPPCDTRKCRELVFHALPLGQLERALIQLHHIAGLVLTPVDAHCLRIEYDLTEHTLEDIEALLSSQGFHLEATLLIRIRRALAYHCERVQRHSMGVPAPRTKNYQAFADAWSHRPHGDHDDTPEVWRQYK